MFFDGEQAVEIAGERYVGGAAHGSAARIPRRSPHLALGSEPLDAARAAKRIASDAVRDGLRGVGEGPGPVDVFGGESGRGP